MPDDKVSRLDYFAGCALCGLLAMQAGDQAEVPDTVWAARTAYEFADAMEKERGKWITATTRSES